jgi:hypothetical protein
MCIQGEETCIQGEETCIQGEETCIQGEETCIQGEETCIFPVLFSLLNQRLMPRILFMKLVSIALFLKFVFTYLRP